MTVDFDRYETIRVEREDDILILTLNRPERLNAVNGQMHTELAHIFLDVDRDQDANVVVITGAGRGFCAGGDVSGMTSESGSNLIPQGVRVRGEAHQLVEGLLAIEKPVIAMVNGPAVGLGATIALLCDVIVAAEDARFGDTHVNVGLVAGDGGAVIWPLLVGVARAKEYLMTGKLLSGTQAAAIGLVNHAVPREELRPTAMALARQLGDQMPYAVRATKVAVNRLLRRQVLELMDACLAWEDLSMKMADHREAATAFLEKRRPRFTGR
jgi:enoyl-CoA hydratase